MNMTTPSLRELLLFRHAKSDRTDPTLADFDRPLAERGKEDAHTMGQWIQQQRLQPDFILVSPAKRTLQTIKRARSRFDADNQVPCIHDERIYEAPMTHLLAALADVPSHTKRVMMVGHNPGLEQLMNFLAGQDASTETEVKLFPTAAIAHFVLPADWQHLTQGCGKLLNLWRVKELPSTTN